MELKDCVRELVKARNAISRTLLEHTEEGDELTFTHKHKTHHFLISEELVVPSDVRDVYTVACLNTEGNLEFLIEHWDAFLQPMLSVLFVNPRSAEHWKVSPQMHDRITDEKNLKKGLKALFDQVPAVR